MNDRTDEVLQAIADFKAEQKKLSEGWRQQQSAQHDQQLSLLKTIWETVLTLKEKFERFLRP